MSKSETLHFGVSAGWICNMVHSMWFEGNWKGAIEVLLTLDGLPVSEYADILSGKRVITEDFSSVEDATPGFSECGTFKERVIATIEDIHRLNCEAYQTLLKVCGIRSDILSGGISHSITVSDTVGDYFNSVICNHQRKVKPIAEGVKLVREKCPDLANLECQRIWKLLEHECLMFPADLINAWENAWKKTSDAPDTECRLEINTEVFADFWNTVSQCVDEIHEAFEMYPEPRTEIAPYTYHNLSKYLLDPQGCYGRLPLREVETDMLALVTLADVRSIVNKDDDKRYDDVMESIKNQTVYREMIEAFNFDDEYFKSHWEIEKHPEIKAWWVDRSGRCYPIGAMQHQEFIMVMVERENIDPEKSGWLKCSCENILTGGKIATSQQIEAAFDYISVQNYPFYDIVGEKVYAGEKGLYEKLVTNLS